MSKSEDKHTTKAFCAVERRTEEESGAALRDDGPSMSSACVGNVLPLVLFSIF
jgi:hypothetical protein